MAKTWTAIELTQSEALVIQARGNKKGAPAIHCAARIPLPEIGPGADEAMIAARAEGLREGLKKAGIQVSSAIVVAPKRLVTVRYATLPSIQKAELDQMAQFEARRHIPFNADRHVVSHHVMRKEGISGSNVVLAAADTIELDAMVHLLSVAGIETEAIDVSSTAEFSVLAAAPSASFATETSAIVRVGRTSTDISIVMRGELVFARSTPTGAVRLAAELSEAIGHGVPIAPGDLARIDVLLPNEGLRSLGLISSDDSPDDTGPANRLRGWTERLALEIQRSHGFVSRAFDCPAIGRIYIAGEAAQWPNFDSFMEANFGVDVNRIMPFDSLDVRPGVDPAARREQSVYVAAVGALARRWSGDALKIDLLPESHQKQRVTRKRRRSILTTVLLALTTIVLGVVHLQQVANRNAERIAVLHSEIKDLKPQAEKLIDKKKQVEIIMGYREDKRSALAVLNSISGLEYVPNRIALTHFEFDRSSDRQKPSRVFIYGYGWDMPQLHDFAESLETAKFDDDLIFDRVTFRNHTPNKKLGPNRPQELWFFELICDTKI